MLFLITLESGETSIEHCSARGESLQVDQCFRPFSVIYNHEIFIKYNLPTLLVLVRQRENYKNTSIFRLLTRI